MSVFGRLIRGAVKLAERFRSSGGVDSVTKAARSQGNKIPAANLDPIYEERTWTEPPGNQPPEAGFVTDGDVSVEDSVIPTELIEEAAGFVESVGDSRREVRSIRGNADVITDPEGVSEDASLLSIEYAEDAGGAGNFEFRRDGTIQGYRKAVEFSGLDKPTTPSGPSGPQTGPSGPSGPGSGPSIDAPDDTDLFDDL